MWRKFPNFQFGKPKCVRFCRKIAIAAVIVLFVRVLNVDARGGKDWVVLQNCQLIVNPANDGDSFHVQANDTEYLVRLYFVDAPETASVGPARLIEQAEYFRVSVPQVVEIGLEAKRFVDAKLSERFTVTTRLAGGLGRSNIQRVYGLVRIKEGDLGEQLVANGLARIHGVHSAMPDGSSGQDEIQKLEQLEQAAKQKKLGAWAISGQPFEQSSATPGRFADASNSPPVTPAPNPATANDNSVDGRKAHAKGTPELGRIDVNTATEKELTTVPGIGHVMAGRIIAARPFRSADDLKRVSGIGDKKYSQIRPFFQ